MSITNPDNTVMYSENETTNNLVKADILLPKDGYYKVRIKNTTAKDRYYSMAFMLHDPLPADYNADAIVNTEDLSFFSRKWLEENCDLLYIECNQVNHYYDSIINELDFTTVTVYWQKTDPWYYPLN